MYIACTDHDSISFGRYSKVFQYFELNPESDSATKICFLAYAAYPDRLLFCVAIHKYVCIFCYYMASFSSLMIVSDHSCFTIK